MDIAAAFLALITLLAGLAAGWAIARTRGVTDGATVIAERDAARAEPQKRVQQKPPPPTPRRGWTASARTPQRSSPCSSRPR
jgi:hypothetical protein